MTKDPVCGMNVDENSAAAQTQYQGKTYSFCSEQCRREFEKSPKKKTEVQNLRNAIEKRLARMLADNPLRTNYQQHFEEIVAAYNGEKDRVTIETTFENQGRVTHQVGKATDAWIRLESQIQMEMMIRDRLHANV